MEAVEAVEEVEVGGGGGGGVEGEEEEERRQSGGGGDAVGRRWGGGWGGRGARAEERRRGEAGRRGGARARPTFGLSSKGEATAPARLPDMRCLSRSSSTLFFAFSSV